MVLADLTFPLFILPENADIEEIDGILFADGKCLDDKNSAGSTLGRRAADARKGALCQHLRSMALAVV